MKKIRVVRDPFSDLFFVQKRFYFFWWRNVYSSSVRDHCIEAANRAVLPSVQYF